MKINSLNLLLNQTPILNKKFYFISGNEKTLMEKIKTIIVEDFKEKENFQIRNIDTISDFVDEVGLFGDKSIYIVSGNKGIDIEALDSLRLSESHFIFFQENSQKIKKIKNLFSVDRDSYLIDCYELDKDSKIKILNEFLRVNKLEISHDVYWFLIDKLDSKYIFFEKNLNKVLELEKQDITFPASLLATALSSFGLEQAKKGSKKDDKVAENQGMIQTIRVITPIKIEGAEVIDPKPQK